MFLNRHSRAEGKRLEWYCENWKSFFYGCLKPFLPMTQLLPPNADVIIRPVQYTDLELVNRFCTESAEEDLHYSINPDQSTKSLRFWQGPFRLLGILLNRPQIYGAYLPETENRLQGMVQISPFNRTRSTWRVDRVAVVGDPVVNKPVIGDPVVGKPGVESADADGAASDTEKAIAPEKELSEPSVSPQPPFGGIGSQLLRHCFTTIWEARTWLLEVNVNHKTLIALYRQNGFQPMAKMTYWAVPADLLHDLADREPDLPNLLPVSNADAQLLYQLDTMSMPPLVRQVFDRHIADFKSSLAGSLLRGVKHWLNHVEVISGYVFEPQRKAAIGYFQLQLCRDGSQPHQAQLTVNPAYTWLYPELMCQMARITQEFPTQTLYVASSDYQPEREEYLEHLGATRVAHTLMMSRSVWHKVRESKLNALENLQLPEVLQGLQPVRKQPIPSRITLLQSVKQSVGISLTKPMKRPARSTSLASLESETARQRSQKLNLAPKADLTDLPPEEPCC
jgi:hypothetical protein